MTHKYLRSHKYLFTVVVRAFIEKKKETHRNELCLTPIEGDLGGFIAKSQLTAQSSIAGK